MDGTRLGATGLADERLVAGNGDRAAEELLERTVIVAGRGPGNGGRQRQQKERRGKDTLHENNLG